ncbi:MAG TPA: ATP-binding protein [Anaerolineae bacterium]|jgi:PAS domain S-box-containing protein|nr:ATP-binding protein [Anaerolineae bacterium]
MTSYSSPQRDYILEISRAMTSRLELPSLLELVLRSAVELLRGQVGLIVLRGRQGDMRVRASYGLPEELLRFFQPLWHDLPLMAEPEATLGRWRIPDLQVRLGMVAAAAGLALSQVVALPLMFQEQLLGVIYVFRMGGRAFSQADRMLLAAFADQAAIAVRNAELYQQVSEEQQALSTILENSAEGVMIVDPEGRVEVFNRSLARMTGVDAGGALGKPASEMLELRDRQGHPLPLPQPPRRRASAAEQRVYVEGDVVRRSGPPVTVGVTATPLYDAERTLARTILNVVDITRFRQAEELKSTFVSVVSHELKTPVALIKGYAETLRREDAEWDRATVRDGLDVIAEEADHLTHLIDSLLEASRIQAGGLKLQATDVNLPRLAEKVVDAYRTQTRIHTFELDFPPDFPAVWGDPERLREVFTNLVSNAVKYSPDGGRVWVGGRTDRTGVTVYVADQGIGIPAEEQARIFDRFHRVQSGQHTDGTGLGLYLVKAIVEAHGGRVSVESVPERGSIFMFTLPAR